MVNQTLRKDQWSVSNYRNYTDKYFLRMRQILEAENINPFVRYQVFARKDIEHLVGIDEAIDFIREVAGDKVNIYSLREGDRYNSGEPMMKLEGRVQNLIDLETVYLSILSGNLTGPIDLIKINQNIKDIHKAGGGRSIYDFSARHFYPCFLEVIAKLCCDAGFAGTSTDIGAKAWEAKGIGTIPHAGILVIAADIYEKGLRLNPTVETARKYDRNMDASVSRIILPDTFNREIYDALATFREVPRFTGARIDTCGENYTQGSQNIILPYLDVEEKYLKGKGVKIPGVWALKRAINTSGFEDKEVTCSSGFNAKKTFAFNQADKVYQEKYEKPLFGPVGTGSYWDEIIMTTSDIVAYYSEKQRKWVAHSKVGREEKFSDRLEMVK